MNRLTFGIYTVLMAFSLAILTGCHRSHDADVVPNAGVPVTYKDVVYATDTVQQSMDVYLPANRSAAITPVVVLIHGGGWLRGDKADFDGLGLDTFFTSRGCALVNMNYRLDTKYEYPAPVFDIGLVLDYVQRKSVEWGVNAGSVCLFGRSSGSQLAMMYAYGGNKDGRVKVVIDGFGPTDLTDSTVAYAPLGEDVAGLLGTYAANPQAWHDASPLYYIASAVPTVIFQGTNDSLVYYKQSALLQNSLNSHHVPCLFAEWQGVGHGWAQDKWLAWSNTTYDWIRRFL
jgi:acetyl esterase/lipase